jgi:hypothetical protein
LYPIQYKVYPSLLSLFRRHQQGYLPESDLIDRINRVPLPKTSAQLRGTSFEEAVIKGTDEEAFDPEILNKVRALLPRPMVRAQVYCEHQIGSVLFYGFVDVIGRILAADIKTTGNYTPGQFADSHQNLYLPALRSKGIRSLRYVITDFRNVFQEDYDQSVDLSVQENEIHNFCEFLEEHRNVITDRRIFGA